VNRLHPFRTHRIGLALSGGSVRGLAHIGVIKVLSEAGLRPAVVAGTSAGSLIGAMLAAGMDWREMASLARSVFWPKLLHGDTLRRFCSKHLPACFADLKLPFAAIATEFPAKQPLILAKGELPSAISASCAMRLVRRPVRREGRVLKDGGITCVLPSQACRAMGADLVVGSDVWEVSSFLRSAGVSPIHPRAGCAYPGHYRSALSHTDLLIHPRIPFAGYWPGCEAVGRMISAGESATLHALSRIQ